MPCRWGGSLWTVLACWIVFGRLYVHYVTVEPQSSRGGGGNETWCRIRRGKDLPDPRHLDPAELAECVQCIQLVALYVIYLNST